MTGLGLRVALAGRSLAGRRAVRAAGPGRQGGGWAGRRLVWFGSVGGCAVRGRVACSGQSCTVASMVSRRARPTFPELIHGPMGHRSSTILGGQRE
jgi:hypothetical protein